MARESVGGEELTTEIKNAAGIILAVTENRNWLEVFFEGDLMHTRRYLCRGNSTQDDYL